MCTARDDTSGVSKQPLRKATAMWYLVSADGIVCTISPTLSVSAANKFVREFPHLWIEFR
jgi:hypothetical protein